MRVSRHLEITGGALWNWFKAQCYDSLAVAVLWLIGLLVLHVPWAPFWAIVAGVLQFIPHFGPVLGMVGPTLTAMIAKESWLAGLYVLILYAVIVVIDGLLLQPYLLRRTARVPLWASILAPLIAGLFLGFWWVLLVAPLLAVLYAYRAHFRSEPREEGIEVIPPESQPSSRERETPPVIEG